MTTKRNKPAMALLRNAESVFRHLPVSISDISHRSGKDRGSITRIRNSVPVRWATAVAVIEAINDLCGTTLTPTQDLHEPQEDVH
ncbi:hypothetical protein [Asticcacaulis sp. AND118]|uniref:hypothetical protein n=1 Tax=Asticcacaulis sp. AND118 TaxID=2840468 RepID=UPI001D000D18|nr:hypothetical protein [Asticcacaulis sp. AND118]UDF03358.1 hypothetical protein LH365_13095 [Asticcacaulis sp. AND118]